MLIPNVVEWQLIKEKYLLEELPAGYDYTVLIKTEIYGYLLSNFYSSYDDEDNDFYYLGIHMPNGFLPANLVGATHMAIITNVKDE